MTRTNNGSVTTAIMALLREAGEPMTASQLREAIGRAMDRETVHMALWRLRNAGLVRQEAIEKPTRHGARTMWVAGKCQEIS